jgi:hypothetical protein
MSGWLLLETVGITARRDKHMTATVDNTLANLRRTIADRKIASSRATQKRSGLSE